MFDSPGPAFGSPMGSGLHLTPTPSSSSSISHSRLPFFTPRPISPPSLLPGNGADIVHMKLSDLMANPYVEDLFNKWTSSTDQATRQLSEHQHLLQQISSLQNEVFMLRNELANTRRNQDGTPLAPLSHISSPPVQPLGDGACRKGRSQRVVTRPEGLPEEVLWFLDDTKKHEGLIGSESNKSRPKMASCVRREDGSVVSGAEYGAIKSLVRRLVSINLSPLSTPNDPAAASMQRTRKWYQKWYPQNYNDLLTKLEEADPLLALCAGSWKADQMVGAHLYWLVGQAKKEGRQAGEKRTFSERVDFEAEADDLDESAVEPNSAKANSGSVLKKKKVSMGKGKENAVPFPRPISTRRAAPPLGTQLLTLGQGSRSLPLVHEDHGSITPNLQISGTFEANPCPAPGPAKQKDGFLDTGFIQIEKTSSSLRREISTDFPTISAAINLLDAMDANPEFRNTPAAKEVIQFIETIENADPNSPELSEDDTNSQWGHKQLSGTWKGALPEWEAVGCCEVGIRLLAALVRTCRVARFICSERRVRATSFLSDMYLEQIVEHLWELWKAAGGPIVKGKAAVNIVLPSTTTPGSPSELISKSAASVDHKNEAEKALRKLSKDELRAIMESHGIKITSRKAQPTKPEYLADILKAPVSSTNAIFDEVKMSLDKRPSRRNKDSAKPR